VVAVSLKKEDFGVALNQTAYAFDSTTIDLCLSLFPWGKFRRRKAAVKIHTLMDLRGSIPCFIHITSGQVNDLKILDELVLEPGAFYLMDRGYIDFARLYTFTQQMAFFVIRAKCNLDYARRAYRKVDKATGLRCDQTIVLSGPKSSRLYPQPLRRISYIDAETGKRLTFLTNNFQLPALTIPQLYKRRWQVELFFKWIKQHLRIKAFYGTSVNAVKTQIWIAISVYVVVAILKRLCPQCGGISVGVIPRGTTLSHSFQAALSSILISPSSLRRFSTTAGNPRQPSTRRS
jgi:hypothetical protein